jgi:hypothetical protein
MDEHLIARIKMRRSGFARIGCAIAEWPRADLPLAQHAVRSTGLTGGAAVAGLGRWGARVLVQLAMRPEGWRGWHGRTRTALAVAALLLPVGCSGGGPSAGRQVVPVTLAWDQGDGLAHYFHVRSGIQLVRSDQPVATLYLSKGTHIVQVEACNPHGCSAPAAVVVSWSGGRWVAAPCGAGGQPCPDGASR